MLGFLLTIFRYVFLLFLYIFLFKLVWLMFKNWPIQDSVKTSSKMPNKIDKPADGAKVAEQESVLIIVKTSDPNLKLGEVFNLGEGLTIGRSKSNDIQILDPFVSGSHAQIVRQEGKYHLKDLQSANGTLLNGYQIGSENEVLANGDIVEIGGVSFKFVRWTYEMYSNY